MDRPDGGGLLGIQAQPLSGDGEVRPPVGDGRRFVCQLAEPFPAQRLQRRIAELQLRHLMTPDFSLTQRGQGLLLLW